jgi:hypothetical protein
MLLWGAKVAPKTPKPPRDSLLGGGQETGSMARRRFGGGDVRPWDGTG